MKNMDQKISHIAISGQTKDECMCKLINKLFPVNVIQCCKEKMEKSNEFNL